MAAVDLVAEDQSADGDGVENQTPGAFQVGRSGDRRPDTACWPLIFSVRQPLIE